MPLINGMKMSCEPCIRGHRSTKCTHANERLMVPVRKPGRPLSVCPHPASRSCSCSAVTAAIPRKQKCSCGPNEDASAETDPEQDMTSATTTPPSPSEAATPSSVYRIQKPASKGSSSRKQSISAVGLERMDSSQLNIMPSYDGQQKPEPLVNGHMAMTPYGPMAIPSLDGSYGPQPMMYPAFPPPIAAPAMSSESSKPTINGHATPTNRTTETAVPSSGGCCGGKPAANTATSQKTIHKPDAITSVKATRRSCCTPPDSPETKSQPDLMPAPPLPPQPNGVMIPPFQTPVAMPNGMYSYYPQPTVFTYPPQYGSYLQPLQPEQWRHVMTALSFGQPIPPNAFGMPGPMTFPPPTTPTIDAGTSHHCSCGNSCQCVGCAAHPYNEATQDYVRSAFKTMAEDAENGRPHIKADHSQANGISKNDGITTTINGTTTSSVEATEQPASPTEQHTPSDAASGTTEEQTLSANDFFFVSYPFGDACAGETTSCPCGDDCQCIGCAIHNTPDTAEPIA